MAVKSSKPFVLIVLDGWGIGSHDATNAIWHAKTPNFDAYGKAYGYTELEASSTAVGLPENQDGNSEAGHMNIGAGRVVEQDSVVISRSISDGTFFKNPAFLQAVRHVVARRSRVHLLGLLSNGQSAHSHPDHLMALLTFFHVQKIEPVFLHLFTDGRDSHRYTAIRLLRKYQSIIAGHSIVATIIGRAYAMDRKKAWKHTELAYDAMTMGRAPRTESSAEDAILHAYNRGETDEFIMPTVIAAGGAPVGTINDHDSVIFFNLRSDRARQLAKPFVQENFERANTGSFKRKKKLRDLFFVAMADFGPDLGNILTAYPSRDIVDSLPVALAPLRQLYIAESEKYAHMTYFFNGGYDRAVANEDRVNIPSPDSLSYVAHPRMGLHEITTCVLADLQKRRHDFIGINISNADMLGHTGDISATIKAVEYTDECVGKIVRAALAHNGTVCITADHGNAEEMLSHRTGEVDTEHSKNKVPLYVIREGSKIPLAAGGRLADVAPTVLALLAMPQPKLMTGRSLLKKSS